jgi:signal transduction histidine kinase
VRLWADRNEVVLEVSDDGAGMPPSNGEARAGEVGGLGLVLVAQRIRSLGGRWRVRGQAPGTSFEIRFPVVSAPGAEI